MPMPLALLFVLPALLPSAAADPEAELTEFYARYRPALLAEGKVDTILFRYADREQQIMPDLHEKYATHIWLVDALPAAFVDSLGGPDALHEVCQWAAANVLSCFCGVVLLAATHRAVVGQLVRREAPLAPAAGTPARPVSVSLGSTHPSVLVPLCAFCGGAGCVLLLVWGLRDNHTVVESLLHHGIA